MQNPKLDYQESYSRTFFFFFLSETDGKDFILHKRTAVLSSLWSCSLLCWKKISFDVLYVIVKAGADKDRLDLES